MNKAGSAYSLVSQTCHQLDYAFVGAANLQTSNAYDGTLSDCDAIALCASDASTYGGQSFRLYYGNPNGASVNWICDVGAYSYTAAQADHEASTTTGNEYVYTS